MGGKGKGKGEERRDGGWGSDIRIFFFFTRGEGMWRCTVRTGKVDGIVLVVC